MKKLFFILFFLPSVTTAYSQGSKHLQSDEERYPLNRLVKDVMQNRQTGLNSDEFVEVIAMETATGKVCASLRFTKRNSVVISAPAELTEVYEPVGLDQVAILIAGLSRKKFDLSDTIDVKSGRRVLPDGRIIVDSNAHRGGYGKISVAQVLKYNSQIGELELLKRLDYRNDTSLFSYFSSIGYGKPTNIAQRYVMRRTSPFLGIRMQPIEMLMFMSGIANSDSSIAPRTILKKVQSLLEDIADERMSLSQKPLPDKMLAAGKSIILSNGLRAFCGYTYGNSCGRITFLIISKRPDIPAYTAKAILEKLATKTPGNNSSKFSLTF